MTRIKVEGKRRNHKVFLYTLSTCGWCKRTKHFLKENKVEYEYLDFDAASPEERKAAASDISARGVKMAFPIIMIDDDEVVVGFKENSIREALGL